MDMRKEVEKIDAGQDIIIHGPGPAGAGISTKSYVLRAGEHDSIRAEVRAKYVARLEELP